MASMSLGKRYKHASEQFFAVDGSNLLLGNIYIL